MSLSKRTLAEMKAGAQTVAANKGEELDPNWLKKVMTVQERLAALRYWERKGMCRIEKVQEKNGVGIVVTTNRVVWVGQEKFTDEEAESNGAWPSELLIAQVTLAVDAGRWDPEVTERERSTEK